MEGRRMGGRHTYPILRHFVSKGNNSRDFVHMFLREKEEDFPPILACILHCSLLRESL